MAKKRTTVKDLQAGDVVILKSQDFHKFGAGRNRMTIEKILKGYASCVWFGAMSEFRREKIETSALKKVSA